MFYPLSLGTSRMSVMSRVVSTLFFDMNSFFASVAQQEEPALMGRPVGVITKASPNAACIAASIEAKRQGVRMGTGQDEARLLCPGIVFRPVRHDVCVAYHHRIRAVVDRVIPIETAHSVDEFSCRLTGSQQRLEAALDLGHRLQKAVLADVGPAMHCSVGLGPNKLLAKIAAELHKPGGLNWLLPEVLPDRIAHLDLDDLPGISRHMKARLNAAGVDDVRQLYALAPRHARAIWRSVTGEYFIRELHGETVVHPVQHRAMIGHGQVLTGPNRRPDGARLVARRLLVKAAARLRREGMMAGSLHVGLKCREHGPVGREGGFARSQDTFFLLGVLDRYWRSLPCRDALSVQVTLGNLIAAEDHVPDLFACPGPGRANRAGLCGVIDRLNLRFGQDTVHFGELPRYRLPYTGAKIAFGRIPTAEDFLE
jgi:nucleotidyltransferase/DNA polymerase involved in DNA repair